MRFYELGRKRIRCLSKSLKEMSILWTALISKKICFELKPKD